MFENNYADCSMACDRECWARDPYTSWHDIALLNNMQLLKFKAKLMITFYAAINNFYKNHWQTPETKEMDRTSVIVDYNSLMQSYRVYVPLRNTKIVWLTPA